MRRIYIAIIAFALVIGASTAGYYLCIKSGEKLSSMLEEAAYNASEQSDLTLIADNIKREWSKSSILFKATQIGKDYTEIDFLINKLQSLALKGDYEAFEESCMEAVYRLRFITDNEKPSFENIF